MSIHSSLLHSQERTFLIGIVEPPTFPEIARGGGGWNLGAPVAMERHAIDPAGNVQPVCHSRPDRDG